VHSQGNFVMAFDHVDVVMCVRVCVCVIVYVCVCMF